MTLWLVVGMKESEYLVGRHFHLMSPRVTTKSAISWSNHGIASIGTYQHLSWHRQVKWCTSHDPLIGGWHERVKKRVGRHFHLMSPGVITKSAISWSNHGIASIGTYQHLSWHWQVMWCTSHDPLIGGWHERVRILGWWHSVVCGCTMLCIRLIDSFDQTRTPESNESTAHHSVQWVNYRAWFSKLWTRDFKSSVCRIVLK